MRSTLHSVRAPGIAFGCHASGTDLGDLSPRLLLITEITIGLVRVPGNTNSLAELMRASAPTDPGCPGGIIDPVGYQ
jgi:hypothetical protein